MNEVIADPASWMLASPIWAMAAWVGWNLDEWRREGFNVRIRTDIRYRIFWLFLSVAAIRWRRMHRSSRHRMST